ncbi:MAG: Gfo/Idh/MocA family oxidoreductase [Limnochordia bacterium]|nr:Gfo/Idh/MocA family oxidoreductase [Limnochordia bacterium]MDD4517994.1 Gfo/Idh/MocA family oxidoreductase [Limnochordia bacterium]
MGQKVRVGLIGCGRVANVHARALNELEQTELVAVCDIKEDRAKDFTVKYNCKDYYLDYKEMLARDDIDAVEICTPHHLHKDMAIDAANAGKHILTEKPMALSVADADAMIEAAEKNGVTLGVIFQNRYNDASVAVKEAIDSNKLGKILGARAFITWKRTDEYYKGSDWKGTWDKEGGGFLIDQAIHTIDLMQWLVGDVETIRATYATHAHDYIKVDDVAEAYIKFGNGAQGCLYGNCFYAYDAPVYLEIVGENGIAEVIGSYKGKAVIKVDNRETTITQKEGLVLGKSYWGPSHIRQIEEYYTDLLAGRKPVIDGKAGKVAMAMVLAMYESHRQGKPIDFQSFLNSR